MVLPYTPHEWASMPKTKKRDNTTNRDKRTLAWTQPMEALIQRAGGILFSNPVHQQDHNLIISESLAQFSKAADKLTLRAWLKLIEAYNAEYAAKGADRPASRKGIYLFSQEREYLQQIGDAMLRHQAKWPHFILIRRQEYHPRDSSPSEQVRAYSALPLIIFSLLHVSKK